MTAKTRTIETSSKTTHTTHKIPFCHSYAALTRITSHTNEAMLQQTAQQLGTEGMVQETVSVLTFQCLKGLQERWRGTSNKGPKQDRGKG